MKEFKIRQHCASPYHWVIVDDQDGYHLYKDGTVQYGAWINNENTVWSTKQEAELDKKSIEENIDKLKKQIKQSEVTYEIGDKFKNTWGDDDAVIMLCSVKNNKIGLMNIGDYSPGHCWAACSFEVENPRKITQEELTNKATWNFSEWEKI